MAWGVDQIENILFIIFFVVVKHWSGLSDYSDSTFTLNLQSVEDLGLAFFQFADGTSHLKQPISKSWFSMVDMSYYAEISNHRCVAFLKEFTVK